MPRWLDLLRIAEHWIGRLYGAFFLVLAFPLLYWGGRGLLAYQAGIRAAWSEPLACAAGLIGGVLSLWVGARVVRSGVPPGFFTGLKKPSELEATLEEVSKLERTDPTAARQLLDDYFMREAAATDRRRAELRRRSPHDLNAAIVLRRELREEVKNNARFRKDVQKRWPEERRESMLAELNLLDSQLQSELLQLGNTIDKLRVQ